MSPLFELSCTECKHRQECIMKYEDENPKCKACGAETERLFPSKVSHKFIGVGWGKDYKNKDAQAKRLDAEKQYRKDNNLK